MLQRKISDVVGVIEGLELANKVFSRLHPVFSAKEGSGRAKSTVKRTSTSCHHSHRTQPEFAYRINVKGSQPEPSDVQYAGLPHVTTEARSIRLPTPRHRS